MPVSDAQPPHRIRLVDRAGDLEDEIAEEEQRPDQRRQSLADAEILIDPGR
jgi:hypothetical protein